MRLRIHSCLLVALSLVSLAACSDLTGPISGTSEPSVSAVGGIQPMCQAGCIDIDPYPDSMGLFLGTAVTGETCMGGIQTDTDQDGLSDYCEKNLATAFAPWMRYFYGDDVSHEGYWAARSVNDSTVRLFYALGYYVDLGVFERYTECKFSTIGEILAECDGHHGDSEFIWLDVNYRNALQHWVLSSAKYSHHTDALEMPTNPEGYASFLQWKDKLGGAPYRLGRTG